MLAVDVPDPLWREFTLAAVWDDLAGLAGEAAPDDVRVVLSEPLGETHQLRDLPAGIGANGDEGSVNEVLREYLAVLEVWGISDALTRSLVLGPFWAALSRVADEQVVPTVRDLPCRRGYQT